MTPLSGTCRHPRHPSPASAASFPNHAHLAPYPHSHPACPGVLPAPPGDPYLSPYVAVTGSGVNRHWVAVSLCAAMESACLLSADPQLHFSLLLLFTRIGISGSCQEPPNGSSYLRLISSVPAASSLRWQAARVCTTRPGAARPQPPLARVLLRARLQSCVHPSQASSLH